MIGCSGSMNWRGWEWDYVDCFFLSGGISVVIKYDTRSQGFLSTYMTMTERG